MPLDLNKLGNAAGNVVTDPRDIFAAIPSKPFPRLRLEQGEVLKAWYQRRTRRDTVIKQNTGGGKTTIGLLIAQSSLNEGVGPAVYLTPDTYLAEQVVAEAKRLQIPTTQDARSDDFRVGEAVLVTTFAKLINGRSSFGVSGTGRPTQSLGTVVVDDAHSALAIAEAQFRTTVPSSHAAFKKITDLFADALKAQSPSGWRAIDQGQPSAPVPVPFWSWQVNTNRVRDILEDHADDDKLKWLFFSWPLVNQVLEVCNATVTASSFEIRPPCSPVELIPAFANAKRRVYLTATLADDGVLVTDLGAAEADVRTPVTPERAADLGDRLILAPLALNPTLSEDSVRDLVYDFSRGKRSGSGAEEEAKRLNAVVLVPSDSRADLWRDRADYIWHVDDLKKNAPRLRLGEWLGVVVLVNKYDGVDLPGDACRLLVIDGVPFPLTPGESREAAALDGTDTFAARQTQRIEQGMGRGIRDAEDHCAVLLMGSALAMSIRATKLRKHYSPATEAQIKLSQQLSAQIQGEGMESIRETLDMFLRRDPAWLKVSTREMAGVEYNKIGLIGPESAASRQAFDLARAAQPDRAAQTLLDGIRTLPPYERGWYKEQAAAYANLQDHDRAQTILMEARLANINVTMPLTAIPIRTLRPSAAQADAAAKYLADKYDSGVELMLGFNGLLERMEYDKDRTDSAEAAFEELGRHLGFTTERPDKIYGTGPDVLWATSEDKHLLLELKTGVTREDVRIIKHELDQASGHVSWYQRNYPLSTGIPVFVHPSHYYATNGTPPEGTQVVDPDTLQSIKDRVLGFARAIQNHDGWTVPDVVKKHLLQERLAGSDALLAGAPRTQPAPRFVQNPMTVIPGPEPEDPNPAVDAASSSTDVSSDEAADKVNLVPAQPEAGQGSSVAGSGTRLPE